MWISKIDYVRFKYKKIILVWIHVVISGLDMNKNSNE
jgi:hypothetical protein